MNETESQTVYTIEDYARIMGVSINTARKHLTAGRVEGAYRSDFPSIASGRWEIPKGSMLSCALEQTYEIARKVRELNEKRRVLAEFLYKDERGETTNAQQ